MESRGEKELILKHLGLKDYNEVWDLQKQFFNTLLNSKLIGETSSANYLITCQHPHVITLGKSANESNIQIAEFPGVKYVRIDRGGDITYHGPGQLVVYPILDLENYNLSLRNYIFLLEQAVIETLADFSIQAGRIKEYTGVWVDFESKRPRKIAAIGVKTSRHITMHGLAFNINPDLNYFNLIIPCGIRDKEVTSLEKEFSGNIDFDSVCQLFVTKFLNLLK
jgi:lipoyl(octanoyl) transferase